MTLEELERLGKGQKLQNKISKLKEFLQEIDKININITYHSSKKPSYAAVSNLEALVGKEFINDRVKGDLILAIREEIIRLQEEFDSL